jgi:hypothetical protein
LKRSTTEVLRRGFDSTVANWPLIAIRIAESVIFVAMVIGSIVAAIVPVAVAAGLSHFDTTGDRQPAEVLAGIIVQHWILILYIFLIASAVLLLLIGIHSFVEAGTAKVFVDAERLAGQAAASGRDRFRSFTIDRWLEGGRRSWWSVFWIYNIAWSVGGLILLVPLLATIALMLAISGTGARVAIGCGGLAISILIMVPIAIVTAIWTKKAIAVTVSRAAGAAAALRLGWREIGSDAGRHVAVAVIIFVIAFGGAMVISMTSLPFSFARSHPPLVDLAFAPAQIAISFAQSIFSSAVGLWFLASYVGLTEEPK